MTVGATPRDSQGLMAAILADDSIIQDRKRRLEGLFADTLGREISNGAIFLEFNEVSVDGTLMRASYIGFPYRISRDGEYHAEAASLGGFGDFYLKVGPYAKKGSATPSDFESKIKKINLRDIFDNFQRLDANQHIPK